MNLSLFFGDASDALARVYARLDGRRDALGLKLSGQVIGPFCEYANTLPAHVPLIDKRTPLDKGEGESLLAEAVVPDPCFWTPELPFLYRVQVELRRGSEVLDAVERPLGIRRLGVRGQSLFLEGKRFVIRAISNPSPSGRGQAEGAGDNTLISRLDEFHELATTLCIPNPSDELCEAASSQGVLLIAEVRGDIAAELRRLAQWSAVGIAVLQQGTEISPEARAAAPNLLLAERMTSRPASPAPWAQLILCEADKNSSPSGRGQGEGAGAGESEGGTGCQPVKTEGSGGTNLPILIQRRLAEPTPLAAARAACDELQADLAPLNFAGYLV